MATPDDLDFGDDNINSERQRVITEIADLSDRINELVKTTSLDADQKRELVELIDNAREKLQSYMD